MAEQAELTAAPRGIRLDGATIMGLAAAAVFVGLAIVFGGAPSAFFDLPSILIVIGGTAAATTVCFSFQDLRLTARTLRDTVVTRERDAQDSAYTMLELADFCRRNGSLRLQGAPLARFGREAVLHKGLGLVIDGAGEDEIAAVLREELSTSEERVLRAVAVLRKAAEIAPAMGLIGTLIGLVQMLGKLGDPSVIGPSMAVALLTTLYGAVLANLVLNPLAAKLERNLSDERLIEDIHLAGLVSIARKENVRKLEMMLNGLLPPGRKVQYTDGVPA
ncbi:MAG: MotA/TolQ/ExbB proton channel family protein [Rhodospirillaceae bacterium]|nr:MotA/TolQ/ExbB proton channel family protein [Rhodospirillaceae bacterium]